MTVRRLSGKLRIVNAPILITPDYEKTFKLYVDASGEGIGGVLMQKIGVDHPIEYFSKKLLSYQNSYRTIEKKALALILNLNYSDVYVRVAAIPV